MKKIMFNDKYGLTKAVLEGRKTQTRRIFYATPSVINGLNCGASPSISDPFIHYKIGEEIAVAQSYHDAKKEVGGLKGLLEGHPLPSSKGINNKMFVRADLMPHRIKITNVRVERLQDISEEDCLKEGIKRKSERYVVENQKGVCFYTNDPILAFRFLIDKICGKGTWNSNPWVFVYDFELVK